MIFVARGRSRYRNQSKEATKEATDEKLQNIYATNQSYSPLIRNIQSPPPLSLYQKGTFLRHLYSCLQRHIVGSRLTKMPSVASLSQCLALRGF
jgi:predicted Rossmann fold nucleotide-binding protein DprA/Smf involved in DNA uptake